MRIETRNNSPGRVGFEPLQTDFLDVHRSEMLGKVQMKVTEAEDSNYPEIQKKKKGKKENEGFWCIVNNP